MLGLGRRRRGLAGGMVSTGRRACNTTLPVYPFFQMLRTRLTLRQAQGDVLSVHTVHASRHPDKSLLSLPSSNSWLLTPGFSYIYHSQRSDLWVDTR